MAELTIRGLIGSGLLLLGAQILSRLIGLMLTMYLAHSLTLKDFGIYNICISFIVILGLLQDAGISRTVIKEISRKPSSAADWVGRLVVPKVGVACLAAALAPIIGYIVGYDLRTTAALALAGLILPATNAWTLIENAAQGLPAPRLLAWLYVTVAALQVGFGVAAVFLTHGSLFAALAAAGAASVVTAVLSYVAFNARHTRIVVRLDPQFWSSVVRKSLPYVAAGVSSAAIGRVEIMLLGEFGGQAEAALFVAAFKIFEAALFVVYAMQVAMTAPVARLIQHDRKRFGRLFGWQIGLAASALLPAFIAAHFLAPIVIHLLFPPSYASAAVLLLVLGCVLPVAAIHVFAAGAMMLTDRQAAVSVVQIAVLCLQIGLNALLAPRMGALGATLALGLSQAAAAAAFTALAVRWVAPDRLPLVMLAQVLLVSALSAAMGFCVKSFVGDGLALGAVFLAWLAGMTVWTRLHLRKASAT